MKKRTSGELLLFKSTKGQVKLRGDFDSETIWATQAEMAEVFEVDVRTVNEHLKNIYKTDELKELPTIRKFRIVRIEGNRTIEREVLHYNLDAVLSVGYRVSSLKATRFRQWATSTLRQHILTGYTINKSRISENYDSFMQAVETVRALAPAGSNVDTESVLSLVQMFADTWFSLDAYDKEALTPKNTTKRNVRLTSAEFNRDVATLKTELMRKGEASENFAAQRTHDAIEGIIGNVMQSFGGVAVYPTLESKAAHLMYFIIKNHPFVDGNKRTGAYALIWFLHKVKKLNTTTLSPTALTALTLLIAESNPNDKEKVVALVILLISGR